MHDIKLYL